jgi:hypothetical protein
VEQRAMSDDPTTLTEDDVVDAVSDYLERAEWTVEQRLRTADRGVDIVACRSDHGVLWVEAKGATSSKAGTMRHGQPFRRAQINTHVARAFYTAAAQLESPGFQKTDLSAMAFPTTPDHRWFIDRIRGPISRLGIGILCVDAPGHVRVEATWAHKINNSA